MHYGNPFKKGTASNRLLEAMLRRKGEWCDAWALTMEAHTDSMSTRKAELKQFFLDHPEHGLAVERRPVGDHKNEYRIVDGVQQP
jgi:hypothetical protein